MQATVVAPATPSAPIRTGRRVFTGGVYRSGVAPMPVTVTCVWCGEPITADQKRMTIGFGTLHNEAAKPCVAEFDNLAYGSNASRRVR